MEKYLYLKHAELEDKHWWFVGRRMIVEKIIRQLKLEKHSQIFEAGCGTGGNLNMLARYGEVSAMELDEMACQLANERKVTTVKSGSLPDKIPFSDEYDLIVLLDVLEHIDNDLEAAIALNSRLKPGGYLLVTVPAYQFLWSKHDEMNHHKRRYTLKQLKKVIKNSGYTVRYSSYFNSFLFPIVAGVRLLRNLVKLETDNVDSSDLNLPAKPVNKLLTFLFGSERYLIGNVSIPFGVSVLLLAQKNL